MACTASCTATCTSAESMAPIGPGRPATIACWAISFQSTTASAQLGPAAMPAQRLNATMTNDLGTMTITLLGGIHADGSARTFGQPRWSGESLPGASKLLGGDSNLLKRRGISA